MSRPIKYVLLWEDNGTDKHHEFFDDRERLQRRLVELYDRVDDIDPRIFQVSAELAVKFSASLVELPSKELEGDE